MAASDRIDELKKRYDENPRRFFASLANEYRKAGDLGQAISLCESHLAEQPSNMNGHVVYGQALYESGRLDEAAVTFETAIQLDPENLIALRHLGDISATSGNNTKAREWYERVLDADPRNNEIIELIARLGSAVPAMAPGAPTAADVRESSQPTQEVVAQAVSPHEARTGEFTPPRSATPARSATPMSTPVVSATPVSNDPIPNIPVAATPIVPIESVQTLRTPVVAMPPVPNGPSRESIGLMDLALDFDSPADAQPPAAAESASGLGDDPLFPSFDEVQIGAAAEAIASTGEETMLDAFADPTPAEILAWKPNDAESSIATPVSTPNVIIEGAPEEEVTAVVAAIAAVEEAEPELIDMDEPEVLDDAPADGAARAEPAPPFVTETMAELYLQQGFTNEALEVYRQLAAASPDDETLKARIRSLEPARPSIEEFDVAPAPGAVAPEPEPEPEPIASAQEPEAEPESMMASAPDPEPVAEVIALSARSYFAGLASRRAVQGSARQRTPARGATPVVPSPRVSSPSMTSSSIAAASVTSFEELFPNSAIAPEDEHIALAFARVAGAVEMGGASVQGKPTAPAATELSLDSVFREADARGTGAVSRQSQTLRFDQFFAAPAEEPPAPPPAPSAPTGEPGSPAELQQFQSWLTGLKKP